jgi:hypothetical protein
LRVGSRLVPGLLLVTLAGTFAVVVAAKAASRSLVSMVELPARSSTSGAIVLQQSTPPSTTGTTQNGYLVGMWTSNSSPPDSGTVQVYVRLTRASLPVSNVAVTIVVGFRGDPLTYGPVHTDSYGLATFTITYVDATLGTPISVSGRAFVDGKQLTQQTSFVPQ